MKAKVFQRLSIFNESIIIYRKKQKEKKDIIEIKKITLKMRIISNFIQKLLFREYKQYYSHRLELV